MQFRLMKVISNINHKIGKTKILLNINLHVSFPTPKVIVNSFPLSVYVIVKTVILSFTLHLILEINDFVNFYSVFNGQFEVVKSNLYIDKVVRGYF